MAKTSVAAHKKITTYEKGNFNNEHPDRKEKK